MKFYPGALLAIQILAFNGDSGSMVADPDLDP